MCFYNDDCDWIAEVNTSIDGPAPRSGKCIEWEAEVDE